MRLVLQVILMVGIVMLAVQVSEGGFFNKKKPPGHKIGRNIARFVQTTLDSVCKTPLEECTTNITLKVEDLKELRKQHTPLTVTQSSLETEQRRLQREIVLLKSRINSSYSDELQTIPPPLNQEFPWLKFKSKEPANAPCEEKLIGCKKRLREATRAVVARKQVIFELRKSNREMETKNYELMKELLDLEKQLAEKKNKEDTSSASPTTSGAKLDVGTTAAVPL